MFYKFYLQTTSYNSINTTHPYQPEILDLPLVFKELR